MIEQLICILIIALLFLLVIGAVNDIIDDLSGILDDINKRIEDRKMDKFKMELTWHNCKTYPPKENYNPWLIFTNGYDIDYCAYYKKYGFPVDQDSLHEFWWADISRTVRESFQFEEASDEANELS